MPRSRHGSRPIDPADCFYRLEPEPPRDPVIGLTSVELGWPAGPLGAEEQAANDAAASAAVNKHTAIFMILFLFVSPY